jgi:hypothetical protein
MDTVIRIFVGCSANGEDAEAQGMLEYTLRKYTERPIELTWMKLTRDPASPWYSNPQKNEGWNTLMWATPFSVFRWAVPEVSGFVGRSIYMDVDMIARDDIGKLFDQPIPKGLLWKNEKHSCVMLFDCARMKGVLPPIASMQKKVGGYSVYRDINARPHATQFAGNWNCLDGENYRTLSDPDIKIIHFTKVETQPHFKYALPRLKLEGIRHWNRQATWNVHQRLDVEPLVDRIWKEAQEAGYTVDKYNKGLNPFGPYNAVRGGARVA